MQDEVTITCGRIHNWPFIYSPCLLSKKLLRVSSLRWIVSLPCKHQAITLACLMPSSVLYVRCKFPWVILLKDETMQNYLHPAWPSGIFHPRLTFMKRIELVYLDRATVRQAPFSSLIFDVFTHIFANWYFSKPKFISSWGWQTASEKRQKYNGKNNGSDLYSRRARLASNQP